MSGDDVQLVRLIVNGAEHEVATSCRRSLADVLRHELGLTGTHVGCEHGVCGSCTVLVDGEPVRACLMLGVQADDRPIVTVEGLADDEPGRRAQQAFADARAYQCGFCTPGFLAMARWLLEHEPDADDDRIREVVSSNLCRCTGYEPIIAAIRAALTDP
jgi:carbon-monoxide dehydrogenase small subunit